MEPNGCIRFFILIVKQVSSSFYRSGTSLNEVQRGSGVARSKVLVVFQLWLERTLAFQHWFLRMSSQKAACTLIPSRQWMLPMRRYSSIYTEHWARPVGKESTWARGRQLALVCPAASEASARRARPGQGLGERSWGAHGWLDVCWPRCISSEPDLFWSSKVQT